MNAIAEKFENLSMREKLYVLIALLGVTGALWDVLWFSPVTADIDKYKREIVAIEKEIETMTDQRDQVLSRLKNNEPSKDVKQLINRRGENLEKVIDKLKTLTLDMVPPEQMANVLRDLLNSETNLVLLSLRSLDPEAIRIQREGSDEKAASAGNARPGILDMMNKRLDQAGGQMELGIAEGQDGFNLVSPDGEVESQSAAAPKQDDANSFEAGFYKHGMELVLKGSYLDTLHYLQSLEKLPWQFVWRKFELSVEEYPVSKIRVEIFTLSQDEEWIGV